MDIDTDSVFPAPGWAVKRPNPAGYGEDASAIQMHATGTPAINYTVPTRYVHSHTGIIDRADFDHALYLLMKVLASLDSKTVAEISGF